MTRNRFAGGPYAEALTPTRSLSMGSPLELSLKGAETRATGLMTRDPMLRQTQYMGGRSDPSAGRASRGQRRQSQFGVGPLALSPEFEQMKPSITQPQKDWGGLSKKIGQAEERVGQAQKTIGDQERYADYANYATRGLMAGGNVAAGAMQGPEEMQEAFKREIAGVIASEGMGETVKAGFKELQDSVNNARAAAFRAKTLRKLGGSLDPSINQAGQSGMDLAAATKFPGSLTSNIMSKEKAAQSQIQNLAKHSEFSSKDVADIALLKKYAPEKMMDLSGAGSGAVAGLSTLGASLASGEDAGTALVKGGAAGVGSAAGTAGGAAIGTAIAPGVGTVIGGAIGGALGGAAGAGAAGAALPGRSMARRRPGGATPTAKELLMQGVA